VVLESVSSTHSHRLRSVAITTLNPTVYPEDFVVNAYVVYDPTGCIPYSGSSLHPTTFAKGNRMMFSTVRFENKLVPRKLVVEFDFPSTAYVAQDVSDDRRAIDLNVIAYFTSYTYEDYPGHFVFMPQKNVDDGTRFILDVVAFKFGTPANQNDIVISSPDTIKEYMLLKIKGTVTVEGITASKEIIIKVYSDLQWLPFVGGLLPELTKDDQYIESAFSSIKMIGASQIHDAVKLAAQRLIQFQTDNSELKQCKKVIFLLTDGDENTSVYSINQAINNVNFVNGKCETPVIPLRLGYSYGSDKILFNKYANETCGNNYYLVGLSDSAIPEVINGIIASGYMQINKGTYGYLVDLGNSDMASNLSFSNIFKPDGSMATYRYRFSKDGISWGDWSIRYDTSQTANLPSNLSSVGRYFQYEVFLQGNSNFESPIVSSGIALNYYAHQNFVVFFQPVSLDINSDEYLASIYVSHTATIPVTSSINYGYCQFNSIDVVDYSSLTRSLIVPDRHTILLDRFNEILLTQNRKKYVAINGGWPTNGIVQIYKVDDASHNGELIDPSTYASNHTDGSITFYSVRSRDESFVLCLTFEPVFRILCNIDNYGPIPVYVDDIEIMYNVTKRIPRDSSGKIIYRPINKRLS